MTSRRSRWATCSLMLAAAALVAACSSSDLPPIGVSPTPTRTRTLTPTATPTGTPGSHAVAGLVVLRRDVSAGTSDKLGVPPPGWAGGADVASFDRAMASADWSVDGPVPEQGTTDAQGRFQIDGLPAGQYSLHVSKTLDGNLLPVTVPFVVSDGGTDLVIEVSWGLVRVTETYAQGGAQVRAIQAPNGTHLILQDGRLVEIDATGRTWVDVNGDGTLEPQPCVDQAWACSDNQTCDGGRVCMCTMSCPTCNECGLGVCLPPSKIVPYECNPNGTCAQPGDRCVCVASCPVCDDCQRNVCVPSCTPVTITGITVSNGPLQLVVGRQGQVYATALLSDGTAIDVTDVADWQSSDPAVATVDSWGTVSALAIGTTELTASVGTVQSTPFSLMVVARPTLQQIIVQNQFCYCGPVPLGAAQPGSALRPCLLVPTARTDILPVPQCGQVVQIGATLQFTALGQFGDGSYEDITQQVDWKVVPAEVGDVVNGLFTARAAGTAQLTATLDGVVSPATEVRVVTQPTLIGLSIYADSSVVSVANGGPVPGGVAVPCPIAAPEASLCCCAGPLDVAGGPPCGCAYTITVLRGDQLPFHATAQYDTGEWRDVTDQVTWRSSNAAAAAINANGVMTAVEAGEATIDAMLGDITSNPVGAHVVDQATLLSLTIYQDGNDHVVAKGNQVFFHATGYYDVGFLRDVTKDATWRSNNDAVGGFDAPAVFTGRAAGTVQIWAELDGQQSERLSLEVFATSDLTYCDPQSINRSVWSDNYNRVTLESDCATYNQPGVATLRYTVTEIQPHGGIFNPCLDLYVYQGKQPIRTIRQQGCGDPFLPAGAPNLDQEVLKYQLLAFWDLKDDAGEAVTPGDYTIYGRFYLYYDPVVSLGVTVLPAGGPVPTRTPTPTSGPVCTPPLCKPGEVFFCPDECPGGCGTVCAPNVTPSPTVPPETTPAAEGACYIGSSTCTGASSLTLQEKCCLLFRFGGLPQAISWCPASQLDPSGQCMVCASSPCEGLPTPTPPPAPMPSCDAVPACAPPLHLICEPNRSCTCACEGPPAIASPTTTPIP